MKQSIIFLLSLLVLIAGPVQASWVADPALFVATYYADQNQDVLKKVGYNEEKLLHHWGKYGIKEGRRASPVFDVKYYLKKNPDVAESYGSQNYAEAAQHWYKKGRQEGRPSHPDFDVKQYLKLNPDVAKKYGQQNYAKAIEHYLTVGYPAGRKGK